MLQSGNKIRLIKPFGTLNVGEIYEIGTMTESVYIIRDANTRIAKASVNIDEFDEYFVKIENKSWTEWNGISDGQNLIGFYRTNGKRVQVRAFNCVKAESSCNKTDNFDLKLGIALALYRCQIKYAIKLKEEADEYIENAEGEIKSIFDYIDKKSKQKRVKETDITDKE